MLEQEESKKVNKELEDSRDNYDINQPILQKTIIPYDLNDIQPRATQVCNCDKVRFDPNGRWRKVIFTYKLFQGEQTWKVQPGERAPFWCNLLVFIQYEGKFFMPPINVH